MKNVALLFLALTLVFAGCYSRPINYTESNKANRSANALSTPVATPTATPIPKPTIIVGDLSERGEFIVNGTGTWIDTGIEAPVGCKIIIATTGKVDVGSGWGEHSGEGTEVFAPGGNYPVEAKHRYGLAIQITKSLTDSSDKDRDAWGLGDENPHIAKKAGRVWLAVNDDQPEDNLGVFLVKINACGDSKRNPVMAEPTPPTP